MTEWKLADAEKIRESLTKEQEKEIAEMYRRVYLDCRRQFQAIPKDGTATEQLQRLYLDRLVKQLDEAYETLGVNLEGTIRANTLRMAEATAEAASSFPTKRVFEIQGAFSHVPTEIVNALFSGQVYAGSWSLSSAIWGETKKHQSDINKIIAEGVATNKSTYEIAKALEAYVNPSARKPWDWSKVYPGTSKVVDYNAQRLARTLVSHAYQQSLERVCKNNPFVTGYIWEASGLERMCEICEDRDGQFFPKGDLPMDHPNGMCTFTAYIPDSLEEIGTRLGDWANGKKDPAVEKWYNDMYKG